MCIFRNFSSWYQMVTIVPPSMETCGRKAYFVLPPAASYFKMFTNSQCRWLVGSMIDSLGSLSRLCSASRFPEFADCTGTYSFNSIKTDKPSSRCLVGRLPSDWKIYIYRYFWYVSLPRTHILACVRPPASRKRDIFFHIKVRRLVLYIVIRRSYPRAKR